MAIDFANEQLKWTILRATGQGVVDFFQQIIFSTHN